MKNWVFSENINLKWPEGGFFDTIDAKNYPCGFRSLYYLLCRLDLAKTMDEDRRLHMISLIKKNMSFEDMIQTCLSINMMLDGYQIDFSKVKENLIGITLFLESGNMGHYVVFEKEDGDVWSITDWPYARYLISTKDLQKKSSGYVLVNSKRHEKRKPQNPFLVVDANQFDFGDHVFGKKFNVMVNIENKGYDDLIVRDSDVTCSCSHYEINKKVIQYGDIADLYLEVDTKEMRDSWSAYAYLETNDEYLPYSIIRLKGKPRDACISDPEILVFASDSIMDWDRIDRTIEFNLFVEDQKISEQDIDLQFIMKNSIGQYLSYRVENLTFEDSICKADIKIFLWNEKKIPIITQGNILVHIEKAKIDQLVPFVISPPSRFTISPFPMTLTRIHDIEMEFKRGGIDWSETAVGLCDGKALVVEQHVSKDVLRFKIPAMIKPQQNGNMPLVDFEIMYQERSVIVSVPFY